MREEFSESTEEHGPSTDVCIKEDEDRNSFYRKSSSHNPDQSPVQSTIKLMSLPDCGLSGQIF